MILWILLVCLVLTISFLLAFKSMRDFTEVPKGHNSLFLIRNRLSLTKQLLDAVYQDLAHLGGSISFERLFKGSQSALVIFGPTQILEKYKNVLDLQELEDYTQINENEVSAWEVGVKGEGESVKGKVFESIPEFLENEQFWWQLVVWVDKKQLNSFQAYLRAVLSSSDVQRRKELTQKLHNLLSERVFKLPKAFSSVQLLAQYQKRSFQKLENLTLSFETVLQLVSL